MKATSQRTFRDLAAGLGALAAAVVVQAVIVWTVIDRLEATDAADDEARTEIFHYSTMVEAADEQQANLQAYRLQRDPRALAAYSAAHARFLAAIPRLRELTRDDPPAMRARVDDLLRRQDAWAREVAAPQIAVLRAGGALPTGAPIGGDRLDALHADFAYLRLHEMELLDSRGGVWGDAFHSSRLTLLLGSGSALLLAAGLGWASFRRLVAQQRAARDASDRITRALERANASERAKTTFLANMSHEMLTPLNGVAGMATALGMTGLDERQRGMVSVIHNSAADLEGLIGNLLTLSGRSGAAGKQASEWAFQLGDELRSIAEDFAVAARNKGLKFAIDVPPEGEIRVRGDAARLERVLTCLLSNALKFTERGEVRLGVMRLAGDVYRFEVSDTGVGFDESLKATLFSTFTQSEDGSTRRFGGAGVGLAVASAVAAEVGGRIDGYSEPGKGSRFMFEVTLADAEPAAQQPPARRRAA